MMGGGLFGLLIIGLVVYLIVERSNHSHAYRGGHPIKNDAFEILRERYARGEISDEEYEKKKNLLKN